MQFQTHRKSRSASLAILFTGLLAAASSSFAQETYPARPIRLVLGFSAGTALDSVARVIAQPLGKELGQSVTVENKEGATGMIGASFVVNSKPDGYTILMGTQAIVTAIHLTATPPFDPVKDLQPIVKIASAPLVLFTGRDTKFTNFMSLVNDAKANPNEQTFATAGPGSTSHLGTEVLKRAFGFQARDIGYKNPNQAIIDAATGRVSFALSNLPVARGQLDAGTLRALAVGSKERMPALPQTPSFAELLGRPDFEMGVWYGFLLPAGTPPPIADRLHQAFVKVMADPALRQQVERSLGGGTAEIEDTARFQARIRDEKEMYRKLIVDLGLASRQ